MSEYVWSEKESRKTRHARRKDEREAKAKEAENFMESLCEGVEELERRIDIPEGCVGMLIGKKGENIRRVEQRYKVTIRVEDATASGAPRSRTGPQRLVITGPNPHAVILAQSELDFAVDTLEVPAEMVAWSVGRGGKHINLIRELSGVAVLSVARSKIAEEEGDAVLPERCWFDLKGRRDAVADAKMCLETHLGYHPVYLEMGEAERELDQEIAEAQRILGVRPRRPQEQGAGDGSPGGRGGSPQGPGAKPRGRGRGGAAGRGRGAGEGRGGAAKAH